MAAPVLGSMSRGEFEALQARWYQRLARDGFQDIEHGPGYLRTQARVDPRVLPRAEDAATYYRQANEFLTLHRWRNRRDRRIWSLHCEGKSYRQICKDMDLGLKAVFLSVNRSREAMRSRNSADDWETVARL